MKKPEADKLDTVAMLEAIDDLVNNDFCSDMECINAGMPKRNFTQAEAKQMADIIIGVYVIAHCIYCTFCQVKYLNGNKIV